MGFGLNNALIAVLLTEILDREEFGEAGEQTNYDETAVNSAAVLGLQVGNQMIK